MCIRDRASGPDGDIKEIGRWTQVGTLDLSMMVFVSDCMPENEAVVFYNRKHLEEEQEYDGQPVLDGPAILLVKDSGFNLMCLANDSVSLGNAQDYIIRVRLVEP